MPIDDDELFKGYLFRYFKETGNPVFVWKKISECLEAGEPFPDWVLDYLKACCLRMDSVGAKAASDVARALPGVFGFDLTMGRGNALRKIDDQLKDSALAMAFAAAILNGCEPKEARDYAINTADHDGDLANIDDTTARRRIKKFFEVDKSPTGNLEWRGAIMRWIFKNPVYYGRLREQFPDLPADLFLIWENGEVLELYDVEIRQEPPISHDPEEPGKASEKFRAGQHDGNITD